MPYTNIDITLFAIYLLKLKIHMIFFKCNIPGVPEKNVRLCAKLPSCKRNFLGYPVHTFLRMSIIIPNDKLKSKSYNGPFIQNRIQNKKRISL